MERPPTRKEVAEWLDCLTGGYAIPGFGPRLARSYLKLLEKYMKANREVRRLKKLLEANRW